MYFYFKSSIMSFSLTEDPVTLPFYYSQHIWNITMLLVHSGYEHGVMHK